MCTREYAKHEHQRALMQAAILRREKQCEGALYYWEQAVAWGRKFRECEASYDPRTSRSGS